jgi:hypothetical protein
MPRSGAQIDIGAHPSQRRASRREFADCIYTRQIPHFFFACDQRAFRPGSTLTIGGEPAAAGIGLP